jgi:hypothetical protein
VGEFNLPFSPKREMRDRIAKFAAKLGLSFDDVKLYFYPLYIYRSEQIEIMQLLIKKSGVAESWDDFAQFRTNYQWFHPPIHPAFMQRQKSNLHPSM